MSITRSVIQMVKLQYKSKGIRTFFAVHAGISCGLYYKCLQL
jgi:hypothetical protein